MKRHLTQARFMFGHAVFVPRESRSSIIDIDWDDETATIDCDGVRRVEPKLYNDDWENVNA